MNNPENPTIQEAKILENERSPSISSEIGSFFTQTNLILIGVSVFLSSFLTAVVFTISLPLNTKAAIKALPAITELSLIKQQLKTALTKIETTENALKIVSNLEEKLKTSEAKLITFKGHIYHMMNVLENRIHRQSFPVIQPPSSCTVEKQSINFEHALMILRDRHQFFNWPLLQSELNGCPSLTVQLEQIDRFLKNSLPETQETLDTLIQKLKLRQGVAVVQSSSDTDSQSFFQKIKSYMKKAINLKPISVENKGISQLLFELQSLKTPSSMAVYNLLVPYKDNEIVAPAYEIFERHKVFDMLMNNLEFSIRQLLLSSSAVETVK